MEKCIQSQLIQTEYTARIGEYKATFHHDSVTIEPVCIQPDSSAPDGADPNRNHPRKPLLPVSGRNDERLVKGERSTSCIFLEPSSDRRVSPRPTGACGARTRTSSNTARTSSKGPVAALLGGIAVSVHGSYEEESTNLLADCAGCGKVWFVDFHDRTGA